MCNLVFGALEFKSKEDGIDPGRIYWPNTEWVVHPIVFSSNHAGDTVTMAISFTVSTTISSGLVEIDFPSGFALSSSIYYLSPTILSIPQTNLESNSTISISLTNIVLPLSAGSYGPFSIYTRESVTGQTVDMNINFCSVGIGRSSLPPPSDSLSISFSDINMNTVGAKSSLTFTFVLTNNLWKHDIIVINVPSYFTALNPVCTSINTKNNTSHFNTTGINTHSFDCYYENSQIFIYGLNVDLNLNILTDTGSLIIAFLITGFTNPIANYDMSLYQWTLTIYRFSTSIIVQQFTGFGPETYPGLVLVNSWNSHNGYNINNIVPGLTLFMDLVFTADHLIPAAGMFSISFTGVDLATSSWKSDENQGITGGISGYYFIQPYIGGTCTILTTSISCNGFANDIAMRSTIAVSLLVLFGSTSATVNSITTYIDSNTVIDSAGIAPLSLTYSSTVVLASTYSFLFSKSTDTSSINRVCNTGGGLYYIAFYLSLPSVAIGIANSINLIFPISTTSPGDFTVNTGNILAGKYIQQATLATVLTGGSALTGISVTSQSLVFSTAVTSNNYLSAIFYIDNGSGSAAQLNLPHVSSNLWTMYETRVELTISNILYTFSSPLTILSDSPAVTFNLLCTNSGKAGLPAMITGSMNFAYSSLYYLSIDIQFSGGIAQDLGSGLITGENYPFDTDSTSAIPNSATMTLTVSSTPILTISGLTSLLTTSSIRAYFPIGSLAVGSYTTTISLYYLAKDRSDVHYEIFRTSSIVTAAANVANWQTATSTLTTKSIGASITGSAAGGLDIKLKSAIAAPGTLGYVGLILPSGFQVNNPIITDGVNNMANPLKFSSNNIFFAFPGILAQETASLSLSNSVNKVIQFLGISTAGYVNFASPTVTLTPYETGLLNTACESLTGVVPIITLTPGILSPNVWPSSVTGRGPNSIQITTSINVTTINAIPSGGYIEFSLNTAWSITTNTQFSVTGIGNAHFSSSAPYQIKGFNQINAGADIIILITNLMPPINSGLTSFNAELINYIYTFAGTSSQLIDSWNYIANPSTPSTTIQVNIPNPTGTITFLESSAFPNTASTFGVSIYLSFNIQSFLPAYSIISITSPTQSWSLTGDIHNNCWFSLQYASCVVSGSQILITTIEAFGSGIGSLNLLIDQALDTPSSTAGALSFQLTTTFASVLLDTTGGVTSAQTLQLVNPPSTVFTPSGSGLIINPNNAGVFAYYLFTFTISVGTVVGDEIYIKFPNTYDAYLGDANVKFTYGEPNNYYLDCKSSALGNINCFADHWYVVITNMNTISAGTIIDIQLNQIMNPLISTAVNFNMYLLSSSLLIKAMKIGYQGVAINSLPYSNIIIRTIDITNSYLQQTSDYTFTFYLDSITFAKGDALIINFPQQFMLDRDISSNQINCSSSYKDEFSSSTSATVLAWDSGLNCTYIGFNQISANISSLGSWTSSDKISLTLSSIPNPDWGFSRNGYPDADDSQYFTIYSYWSSSFKIFAFDNTQGNYVGQSFGNLEAGFVGFNDIGMTFSVGGYNPAYSNTRLLVAPGTQTLDISISITHLIGLHARKVIFYPKSYSKNNVVLEFSSVADSFFMLQGHQSINFRISAPITVENQLAYIEWTIDEYSLIGLTGDAYQNPPKTLVEIYRVANFTLTSQLYIQLNPNSTSTPIQILAENPPNANFTISLSFLDPTLNGIQIYPTKLTFLQDISERYFTISVSSSFTGITNKEYSLQFFLSGVNAGIYSVPSLTFVVLSTASKASSALTFSAQILNDGHINVYVTSQINTQIYWQFSALGTTLYTFSELESMVQPLVDPESSINLSLLDQLALFHLNLEYQPLSNETWSQFQYRLYTTMLTTIWYDVEYLNAGVPALIYYSEDWLWADTQYFFLAYPYDNSTNSYNITATTSSINLAVLLELLFSDLVVESKAYPLTTIVAYNLGVPEQQLYTQAVRSTAKTTTFSWILTTFRRLNTSPGLLYKEVNQNQLADDIFNSGITNTIVSFTASTIESSQYQSPYWTNSGYPSYINDTNSSVLASLKSAVAGTMCCVSETNFSNNSFINPTQVYLLLGRDNLPTAGSCVNNSDTDFNNYEMNITGLLNNTNYTVTCAAYNEYPLWQDSVPYDTIKNLLPNFTFVTQQTPQVIIPNSFSTFIAYSITIILLIS